MHELINTSVPNGLIPGSHGFSTVAMTRGMSDTLRTKLEMLSGYSHVYSGHDDQYFTQNPESWNHLILATGEHVFSRVAVAPFDYTGRTNRLAHHIIFSSQEITTHNPADILNNGLSAILRTSWEGEPRWLESRNGQEILASVPSVGNCEPILWKELLGSGSELFIARLATYYANLVTGRGRPICLVRSAQQIGNGAKMMALAKELIALLPPNIRHLATFSTYAPLFPAGVKCDLRVVTENDPHLAQIRQHSFCIDWGHGGVLNSSLLPEADASILNAVKTGCWQYIAPQKQPQAVSEKRYEPTPQQQSAYQSSQATSVQRLPQSQYAQPPRRTSSKPYVRTQSVSSQSKVASSSSSWKWWLVIAGVVVIGVSVLCCISKNKEETPTHATSNQGDEEMRSAGEASKTDADLPAYEGNPQSFPCEENREALQNQKKSSESSTQEPTPAEKESTSTNQQDGADSQKPLESTTLPPEPVANPKEEPKGVEQGKESTLNQVKTFPELLKSVEELKYSYSENDVKTTLSKEGIKTGTYFSYQLDGTWKQGTFKVEKLKYGMKVNCNPQRKKWRAPKGRATCIDVFYNDSSKMVVLLSKKYTITLDESCHLDELFFGKDAEVAVCFRELGYCLEYFVEYGNRIRPTEVILIDKEEVKTLFYQKTKKEEDLEADLQNSKDAKMFNEAKLKEIEDALKKLDPNTQPLLIQQKNDEKEKMNENITKCDKCIKEYEEKLNKIRMTKQSDESPIITVTLEIKKQGVNK